MAAELELNPLVRRHRLPRTPWPAGTELGERDRPHPRVGNHWLAGLRPEADHHVEHTAWKSRVLERPRQVQVGQRRVLRELHDDRVAVGERRRCLPRRDGRGEVSTA
jgi:hypothetical protein